MSIDRAASRAGLVTLLGTIPALVAVYDSSPDTFGGLSPVSTVTDDGTGPYREARTLAGQTMHHAHLIDLYVRRSSTSENQLAALASTVRALIEANSGANGSAWNSLEMDESFSQMDYVAVDNVDYRIERIRVIVW